MSRSQLAFSWIYTRSFCQDGNFDLDHLKDRCPEDDIALSDGAGYIVSQERYESHLKYASKLKPTVEVCYLFLDMCMRHK